MSKVSAVEKDKLKKLLFKKGCHLWSNKNGLILIPHTYYNKIPEGFEVYTIDNEIEKFKKGVSDNDSRFGMLAYGVLPERYKELYEVLN